MNTVVINDNLDDKSTYTVLKKKQIIIGTIRGGKK